MKNLFIFLHLLTPILLAAQEKGAKPLTAPLFSQGREGTVRAVVIGISDYQSPGIPDLRFADRDASALAEWLRSPSGGSVPEQNIVLLTNEKATNGQIHGALEWLKYESKENDVAVIYFSGHGDVESNTRSQMGFLLPWDSPARSYAAGALYILYLQDVVATLSLDKKSKVLLITDACRSGKLAGSAVGGSQITNASLTQQFANEIKILSCQPDEFSLEGEQWGGGRGVFSYHLVDGLYGLADGNRDSAVNLLEIGRYLEDHVSADAKPNSQIPMVIGNKSERLSTVIPEVLRVLLQKKEEPLVILTKAGSPDIDIYQLVAGDTNIVELFAAFEKALDERKLLEPADSCADAYYNRLKSIPEIEPVFHLLTRDYVVALQEDAQQVLNRLLFADSRAVTRSHRIQLQQYRLFPKYLERAAGLLGQDNFMYRDLKARQLFFEGMLVWLDHPMVEDREFGKTVLEKFDHSLSFQAEAPHTHYYLSLCYVITMREPDSALYHAKIATQQAPTWPLPLAHLANIFVNRYGLLREAKAILEEAMAIDSQDVMVLKSLASWHVGQRHHEQAIGILTRVIELDSTNPVAWSDLGVIYLRTRQLEKAEPALLHSVRLDSNQFMAYYLLGVLYAMTDRLEEAEKLFLRTIAFNPNMIDSRRELARLYARLQRFEEMEQRYLEIVQLDPKDKYAWYRLACEAARKDLLDEALLRLEKSLQNGLDEYEGMMEQPELESIRATEAFKALVKKYFPGK